jgi:hypothetical protein
MKLTSLLFATMAAYTQADDSQRGLATLAQKWNISEPTFSYNSLEFTLTFGVSDYIKGDLEMVKYAVWDENCDTGADAVKIWDSKDGAIEGPNGVKNVTNDIGDLTTVNEKPQCLDWGSGDDCAITDEGFLDFLCEDTVSFDTGNSAKDSCFQCGFCTESPTRSPLTGGDNMNQDVAITIDLDPTSISQNSNIYSEDTTVGAVTAEIRFCLRFELHTPNYLETSVEVNFLETIVTLTVDLSDGFEIGSIAVEPKDRLVRTANQIYRVRAYQCGVDQEELTQPQKDATRVQGSVIKVCVTPDDEARGDGIFMRSIDSFSFIRDQTADNPVEQVAIENQLAAANLLTSYDDDQCKGILVCHFSTILFANFYTSVGSVDGTGIASMQFGSARRLRSDDRNLQEDSAAAAEFELEFGVAATLETPSGASSIGAMLITGLLALSGVAALMM